MYGVDVSKWQIGREHEWKNAKFVIAKATDGTRFVDSSFRKHIETALKNKQLIGFYHFMNGKHKSSAKAQAQFFYDHVKHYIGVGIPVLDFEDSSELYGGSVIKYGTTFAKEFLDEFYRLSGVRCFIYMSAYVVTMFDWYVVAKDYPLWLAAYPGKATYENPGTKLYSKGAWHEVTIHQYSSSNNLDKNIAYITESEWKRLAEGKKRKGVKELARDVLDGLFGTGDDRKQKLGSNYQAVQEEVNRMIQNRSEHKYHLVEKGETLNSISKKYGTPVERIHQWNGYYEPSVGDKIRVR